MTADSRPLSGSGPQEVWIECRRTGQDWDANRSDYHGEVRYYGKGYGTYIDRGLRWSADFGGYRVGGDWSIPYANRYDEYTVLWSGTFSRGHDWAGFGSGFTSRADIDGSAHSSIGTGWVAVEEETPPRIPKTPNAPTNLTFVESARTPVSLGMTYSRGDDMGASIEQDQAHWYANAPAGQGTFVWEDNNCTGYTSPGGGVGPALVPGTRYYVYVRSRNSRGWGPWAGPVDAETLAGGRVRYGGQYRTAVPWVRVGGVYRRARPFVRLDGSYRTVR